MKKSVLTAVCFLLVFVFSLLTCACSDGEALDISSVDTVSIDQIDTSDTTADMMGETESITVSPEANTDTTPTEVTADESTDGIAADTEPVIEVQPADTQIQETAVTETEPADTRPAAVTEYNDTAYTTEPEETTAAPSQTDDTTAPILSTESLTVYESSETTYILNTNTKRFHYPTCGSVKQIKDKNRGSFTGNRDDLIAQGYKSCGNCHP